MSWQVEGNLNARERVSQALENLNWLDENHWRLNVDEIYRLNAIKKATVWRVEAFRYLEKKRMLHDDDYKDIKSLQNRMGKTQQAIKEWEANKAQEQLRSNESLMEENARLMDEIHWLKTELSGLKQTLKWSQRAKR